MGKMIPYLAELSPSSRKVIVYGCGRSGTRYTSKVLDILGVQASHEKCGADGICSWFIVEKSRSQYLQRHLNGQEVIYLHLVRNPLKVIRSLRQLEVLTAIPNAQNRSAPRAHLNFFVRSHPQFNHLRRSKPYEYCAQHWVTWNKEAENNFPLTKRIRVEDIGTVSGVYCLCQLLDIEYSTDKMVEIREMGRDDHTLHYNAKKLVNNTDSEAMQELTLEKLEEYLSGNKELFKELFTMASRYGYNLIDE